MAMMCCKCNKRPVVGDKPYCNDCLDKTMRGFTKNRWGHNAIHRDDEIDAERDSGRVQRKRTL